MRTIITIDKVTRESVVVITKDTIVEVAETVVVAAVVVTEKITTGEILTIPPLENIKTIMKKVLRPSKKVTLKEVTTKLQPTSLTIEVTIIVVEVDIIITRIIEAITTILIMMDLTEIIRATKNKYKVKRARTKRVPMKSLRVSMKVSEAKLITVDREVVDLALTRAPIATKTRRERKVKKTMKAKMLKEVNIKITIMKTLVTEEEVIIAVLVVIEVIEVVTVELAAITHTNATMIVMRIDSRIKKMTALKLYASEVN